MDCVGRTSAPAVMNFKLSFEESLVVVLFSVSFDFVGTKRICSSGGAKGGLPVLVVLVDAVLVDGGNELGTGGALVPTLVELS